MIKAIIFDMDGVIIDTESYYMNTLRKYLDELDAVYSDDLLLSFVGSSDPVIKSKLDPIVSPKMSGHEFIEKVNQSIMDQKMPYKEMMLDGLYETLTHYKSRGYKLAVASSSPRNHIDLALRELEITDFFDIVSSGHDYKESKPNPEIYCHTMEKLGVKPNECIVVEDSELGIQAAKAAGIYVAAIRDNHFGMRQDHADIIIDGLVDTIKVVDDLERN